MKQLFFTLLFLGIVLLSCDNCHVKNNPNIYEDEIEVTIFLDEWHKAAAKTDFDGYFGKIAKDGIYIGTDATERWTKEEFIKYAKLHFDRGKAWKFTAIERTIAFSKNKEFVWFDELLDTWMGVCRGSGVLKKSDGHWEIKHYVLSLTVPNDKIREVIKIIDSGKKNM